MDNVKEKIQKIIDTYKVPGIERVIEICKMGIRLDDGWPAPAAWRIQDDGELSMLVGPCRGSVLYQGNVFYEISETRCFESPTDSDSHKSTLINMADIPWDNIEKFILDGSDKVEGLKWVHGGK